MAFIYEEKGLTDTGTGESAQRTFDYATVQSEINNINTYVGEVQAIANKVIASSDYIEGNAKASVDAYIASIPKMFQPIVNSMEEIKKNLDQVQKNYLAAESSISSALGAGSDATIDPNAPSADVSAVAKD